MNKHRCHNIYAMASGPGNNNKNRTRFIDKFNI